MSDWLTRNDRKSVLGALSAVVLVFGALRLSEIYLKHSVEPNSLLGLGFLLLAGIALGRLARLLRLPSLTGYLLAGICSGPSALDVVTFTQVSELKLVNGLALALIAMQAGAEFTIIMLKRSFKSLFHSTWIQTVLLGVGLSGAFVLGHYIFQPGLGELSFSLLLATGLLFAVVGISKSPAAVIAELSESRLKNKLGDHAIGIVVILDVIVLILFALSLAWARAAFDPYIEFSLVSLIELFSELAASVAAGTSFGLVAIFYLRFVDRQPILFILAISYGVTAICDYLHYETLLVFVVAGFVVTNFSRQTGKLLETIEALSAVVMIIFFATMGASLQVSQLSYIWDFVLFLVLARLVLTWLSEVFSAQLARSGPSLARYGWTPFVSQAGLSVGLAVIIQDQLPGVGSMVATLAVSTITINQIVGPLIFKWGLQKAEALEKK